MKLGIKPFREFWIDCYSVAIYSVFLSFCKVNKELIYANEYEYVLSKINLCDNRIFWSVEPKLNIKKIKKSLLINKQQEIFKGDDRGIVTKLEKFLTEKKIVFLGVDLFYWVEDNFNWHRNHFNHYAILNGFDSSKRIFFVLETGSMGYKEYLISYDELCKAANCFTGDYSLVYDLNPRINLILNGIENNKKNATNIINSIDDILYSKKGDAWSFNMLRKSELSYVFDHIQTHVYSMENRERANKLLFENNEYLRKTKLSNKFFELERRLHYLKNSILKKNLKGDFERNLGWYTKEIKEILSQEKSIWEYLLFLERKQ